MKKRSMAAAAVAASLLVLSAAPRAQDDQAARQRMAEAIRLQQAMHRQDAAGDLDAAIEIYRDLAVSTTADRAVAAEAQYRLAQSLLQQGDLDAAAEALLTLARVFPDHAPLVSRLASQSGMGGALALGGNVLRLAPGGLPPRPVLPPGFDGSFEPGAAASIAGRVTQFAWVNPMSWLNVTDGTSTWTLGVAAPNALIEQGLRPGALRPGDEVVVDVTLDRRGPVLTNGAILGRAESIVRSADGVEVYDRANLPAAPAAGGAAQP